MIKIGRDLHHELRSRPFSLLVVGVRVQKCTVYIVACHVAFFVSVYDGGNEDRISGDWLILVSSNSSVPCVRRCTCVLWWSYLFFPLET